MGQDSGSGLGSIVDNLLGKLRFGVFAEAKSAIFVSFLYTMRRPSFQIDFIGPYCDHFHGLCGNRLGTILVSF